VGKKCVIESHSFLCDSVTLEDNVFIGHGAMFVNDLYPMVGRHIEYKKTLVKKGASIGTNSTIIGGVTIGEYAVVGAGAVVTKDVPAFGICAGNPAKTLKTFKNHDALLAYMESRQKATK
jgi:acetyltransferase-like isoleucine patch superfamily enzyme